MRKRQAQELPSAALPEGVLIPAQTVHEILTVMRHAIYPNHNYLQINALVTRLEQAIAVRESGAMPPAS